MSDTKPLSFHPAEAIDILLVENNPDDRAAAIDCLREARIKNPVHSVGSAEEALRFLRRDREYSESRTPGLVLISVDPPDQPARQLAEAIRALPPGRALPICFLDPALDPTDQIRTPDGLTGTIAKPVSYDQLQSLLKRWPGFWQELQSLPPFPISKPSGKLPKVNTVTAAPFPVKREQWNILVVEDNPADALLLRRLLDTIPGRVAITHKERVKDAEHELAHHHFDAIVSDLGLPDCVGLETVHRLRAAAGNSPLIVVTGTDDDKLGLELISEGATDYLVKDEITPPNIRRCIRYSIERCQIEARMRDAQRMKSLGGLAGGVAHDFNNLLSVVKGLAQLQQMDGNMSDEIRGIIEATDRGARLTRQLLAFSRGSPLNLTKHDLNETVRDFSELMGRVLGPTIDIQLKLHEAPLWVEVDASMIEQVVMNLTVNARDAMPDGGSLTISSSAESTPPSNAVPPEGDWRDEGYARIQFWDTGSGIPADLLPRVFEPFFTTKAAQQGTGLGLSTVHGIVRQHRGAVTVRSETGHGTIFDVYLPLTSPGEKRTVPVRTAAPFQSFSGTLLVVDDDKDIARIVSIVLGHRGFKVHVANHGAAALEMWPKIAAEVDLLLTDLMLPGGMMGGDLARELCSQKPDLKVIFMSGNHHHPAHSGTTFEEGVNFIGKPFDIDGLVGILAETLTPGSTQTD